MTEGLSAEATQLVKQCTEDIDDGIYDVHAHIVGMGHNNTGCYINVTMMTQKRVTILLFFVYLFFIFFVPPPLPSPIPT